MNCSSIRLGATRSTRRQSRHRDLAYVDRDILRNGVVADVAKINRGMGDSGPQRLAHQIAQKRLSIAPFHQFTAFLFSPLFMEILKAENALDGLAVIATPLHLGWVI